MASTAKYASSSKVLLTAADVEQWKAELVTAEANVAALKRKLDAAAVFFPAEAAQERTVGPELSVHDWIMKVLGQSQRAMTPKEIRAEILRAGGSVGSENYLYTAIQRAFRRAEIVKRGDGYAAASAGSSKEETPSHSAGGSSGLFTLSGGGVDALPEAGGT